MGSEILMMYFGWKGCRKVREDEFFSYLFIFALAIEFIWIVVFVLTDPDYIRNVFCQFMQLFK